jgi:hypothetical protein
VGVRYGFIHASVPCAVALFTCRCGASTVEIDVRQEAPNGWLALAGGSHLCPPCAEAHGKRPSN